jgi:hypothetical protein
MMVSMQKKRKKDGGGSFPPGARKAVVRMVDERLRRGAARRDARLDELTEAQGKTEQEIRKLAVIVGEQTLQIKDLSKRVGGISRSWGSCSRSGSCAGWSS